MTISRTSRLPILLAAFAVALFASCNRLFTPAPAGTVVFASSAATQPKPTAPQPEVKSTDPASWPAPGGKVTKLGDNVYLGVAGQRRWVEVHAAVCLTQGFLEHLLSRDEAGKHHESVLSSSFDASHIHAALIAAGAKPGKPVQYLNQEGNPDFKPPSGDKIKITARYKNDRGKEVAVPAQRWVRNHQNKQELTLDWVFAGSYLSADPNRKDRPPFYAANDGRVITTSNFPSSLLDLPMRSDEGDPQEGLEWEVNRELVPPLGTPVVLVLEVKEAEAKTNQP